MPEQLEFWDFSGGESQPVRQPQEPPAAKPGTPMLEKAKELHKRILSRVKMPVRLTITDNRRTLMRVLHAPDGKSADLRLHHMFLDAGEEMLAAIAHWVLHPRSRKHADLFHAYFREHQEAVAPPKPRQVRLLTKGDHFDLKRIFDEENAAHFDGKITASITWGPESIGASKNRRNRSIRYGSYSDKQHLIRIHRVLDQAHVPEFAVRSVVHHEMLHAHLGIRELPSGRRSMHPPEFRRIERAHPDFERAEAWLKAPENLKRLLVERHKRRT